MEKTLQSVIDTSTIKFSTFLEYTDYGDSDNVKVKDACFLDSRFTQYPAFARGCKLFGVKPMLNNRSKYQEDLKKHCWEFFHCKHNDRMKRATFDDDRNTGNYEPIRKFFNMFTKLNEFF